MGALNIMSLVAFARIVSILILTGGSCLAEPMEAAQGTLPVEFSEYAQLSNFMQFGDYTLEHFLSETSGEKEHGINKYSNHIIIKNTSAIDEGTQRESYYKLDVNGKVIDEYNFYKSSYSAIGTGGENLVDGTFLVNLEKLYYTTWPLNGNRTRRPFTPINEDLSLSDREVDSIYSDITKKAARIDESIAWEQISASENKRRVRKVFYLNDTARWYVLYGNSLKSDYTGKEIEIFNSLFKSRDPFISLTPPSNITIPYFERHNNRIIRSHGGGSTNSGPSTTFIQEGMAYYQLRIGGDVLRFKVPEELSVTEPGTAYSTGVGVKYPPKEVLLNQLDYYTNTHLNYALFSVHGALYLVKKYHRGDRVDIFFG